MKKVIRVVVFIIVAIFILGIFFDRGPGLLPTRVDSSNERVTETSNEQTIQVTKRNEAKGSEVKVSLEAGTNLFNDNCAACHGKNGEGVVGPALAANDDLKDASHIIERVLKGKRPMPAFGDRFSDEDVASVASFIRSSWGNNFGEVSVEEVKARR
jgi:mono/diheme cytochrome c family protein